MGTDPKITLRNRWQARMYFSESEESEDDHGYAAPYPTIEEVRDQMDIARFYRNLCSDSTFGQKRSKSVQTEHDISGLPQTWIAAGQKLVDELYTGIGNAINNLHKPPNFNQNVGRGPMFIDVPNAKYFKYEKGYWRFKLDPKVKFPADYETYGQMQYKNDLGKLMKVATDLRNIVSFLDGKHSHPNENTANENKIILTKDKCEQTETLNSATQCLCSQQEKLISGETLISLTCMSDEPSKIDYVSSSDGKYSELSENLNTDRYCWDTEDKDMNSTQGNPESGKSCEVCLNVESSQDAGINVLKYELHPEIRRCITEEAERLNTAFYESVTGTRNTNFVDTGLVSKVMSGKRKMIALSKVKDGKKCSKVVNHACQPSTSKFYVPSTENSVNTFDHVDRKFVKPLGDHNIQNLKRNKSNNDFPCKRPKIPTSGNARKNFIKQNILATKLPLSRSDCSKCEVQNSKYQDALPLTHSVAGSSSEATHESAPCKQYSLRKQNRIHK